jgi:transposase
LRTKYDSLAGRRGKKRALIAIGHKILNACYHIIKNKEPYIELGGDYLDKKRKNKKIANLKRQLKDLGIEIEIKENAA